ncbi:aromatic acid exporter family protein [Clostridium nigeriense]|uniref:FUSC family protein n=1 Tax=Clostridium nigeriense TaxID=1805470 RepID=UPI000836C90A|nr:aromatic acid exporter family protein [Clostridium nigeriense]
MNFTFPKIGLRTLKTALAVFLCLLIFPREPFFACLTAVFCVQDTVSNSIKIAINRGLGTVLGATIGLLFLIVCRFLTYNINIYPIRKLLVYLTIAIGIIVVIYLCNLIKKPGAINISCIAFLAVTTVHAFGDPVYYAVNRTIETLFGIFIALLVNKFIAPPKQKKA